MFVADRNDKGAHLRRDDVVSPQTSPRVLQTPLPRHLCFSDSVPKRGHCQPMAPSSFWPYHTYPQPGREGRWRCSYIQLLLWSPPSESTGPSVFSSAERIILHLHLPAESWGASSTWSLFDILICGPLWVTSIFVLSPLPSPSLPPWF